jgi:Cdc6-like AAA superfamily ATPase
MYVLGDRKTGGTAIKAGQGPQGRVDLQWIRAMRRQASWWVAVAKVTQSSSICFLGYGNRHGLIAGATGTGKTITLQILAEGFSAAGVPVFCPT